jgi:hypothetical protein
MAVRKALTTARTDLTALRLACAGMVVITATIQAFGQAVQKRANPFSGNLFCGPRCIQRVLEYYEKDADLLDLIREIQWPAIDQGTSFEMLAKALKDRGIHTAAVRIDNQTDIFWDRPAIVHLNDRENEHYVVWLPPSFPGGSAKVWDGSYSSAMQAGRFNSLRSGPVLLTRENPIPESAVTGNRVSAGQFGGWNAIGLLGILLAAFLCGYAFPSWKRTE